jgi:hypothetical protein
VADILSPFNIDRRIKCDRPGHAAHLKIAGYRVSFFTGGIFNFLHPGYFENCFGMVGYIEKIIGFQVRFKPCIPGGICNIKNFYVLKINYKAATGQLSLADLKPPLFESDNAIMLGCRACADPFNIAVAGIGKKVS